ncbi:hypothetical protein JCM10213_005135 [Rhodosporidiobolus nylandii]
MLDRLPIELLEHVLRQLDPPQRWTLTKDRQTTLRACSLVSRRMREVAEPMLWEAAFVTQWEHIGPLASEARTDDKGRRVRKLVARGDGFEIEEVVELLYALPSLREVSLDWLEQDPYLLNLLSGAQHVRLERLTVMSYTAPVFPALTTLSLVNLGISPSFLYTILRPSLFPALRALCLLELWTPHESDLPVCPAVPDNLVEQLEVLQVGCDDPYDENLSRYPQKVLFSTNVAKSVKLSGLPILPHIRHLHLRPFLVEDFGGHRDISLAEGLDAFSSILPSLPRLQTVTLPRPPLPTACHAYEVQLARSAKRGLETIRRACEEKKVEVLFDPAEEASIPGLSEVFWECAKRRREEKEKQCGSE